MLTKLSIEERNILTLIYGEDSEHPVMGILTNNQRNEYYNFLIPKMRKILANLNSIKRCRR